MQRQDDGRTGMCDYQQAGGQEIIRAHSGRGCGELKQKTDDPGGLYSKVF